MLVIDDDATVREVVGGYLTKVGLDVMQAADGPTALSIAGRCPPDLAVVDLMLPVIDGLEVCRRLRAWRADLPVVMLTALGTEDDRILGLEVGADDYVTKPFSPRELVLRVQSVLRRAQVRQEIPDPSAGTDDGRDVLVDGDLEVETRARRVRRRGRELPLTRREFDLLLHFLRHPGQAFTRAELMRQVWGWEYGDESTVTVHVRRLREKVERDPSRPERVVTVWGRGYRWDRNP